MMDAISVIKDFRRTVLPGILEEVLIYTKNEGRSIVLVDPKLKWACRFRDTYLYIVYEWYFMTDRSLDERQKAIRTFDHEFHDMLTMIITVLRGFGYDVECNIPAQMFAPVSSAISTLGLTALDCKVSDPYILESILER